MKHQCQNCPRSTAAPEIGARTAGWIVWSGTTIGGEETARIYCPTWDAECRTCDARMSDGDWDEDEGPFTEKDARNWKQDHECEPDVRLITPEEIEKERLRLAESKAKYAAAASL